MRLDLLRIKEYGVSKKTEYQRSGGNGGRSINNNDNNQ